MAKKGRLTNDEKERLMEHARLLFVNENVTSQKELAERVGVTEKTISEWINAGNWKKYKRNFILTREEQLTNLLDELVELNEAIKAKSEGNRFADHKLSIVRRSLVKDIKDLETETATAEFINAFTALINWVKKENLDDARFIGNYAHKFIKTKLR